MGNLIRHDKCPECGSEDNLAVYDDGSHCFTPGCDYKTTTTTTTTDTVAHTMKDKKKKPRGLHTPKGDWRGISTDTYETYGVTCDGRDIYFPYGDEDWKARTMDGPKRFWRNGGSFDSQPLFGMNEFPTGGKAITVTEGEMDALAYYEMTGYPAVSVQGAGSAKKDMTAAYDWLMTFDVIKIVFDADDAGRHAAAQAASVFPNYKVAVVDLTLHKDTNDYLVEGDVKDYTVEWWAAEPKRPSNIIGTRKGIIKLLEEEPTEPIATFPFATLDKKLDGIREGELVYVLAETGQGKTSFIRACEHHVLSTTDYNIGVFHMEEQPARVVEGLLSYHMKRPIHLRHAAADVTTKDKVEAWDAMTGERDRVQIFSIFGGTEIDEVLNLIRYMGAGMDCKVIFLDHTSMLVSGSADMNERLTLDKLTTDLAILAQELKIAIVAVHHVNDGGRARGSRNIEKVAHSLLYIDRDMESPDPIIRNTTSIMIRKARHTGDTGPAGQIFYDADTTLLTEVVDDEEDEDGEVAFDMGDMT